MGKLVEDSSYDLASAAAAVDFAAGTHAPAESLLTEFAALCENVERLAAAVVGYARAEGVRWGVIEDVGRLTRGSARRLYAEADERANRDIPTDLEQKARRQLARSLREAFRRSTMSASAVAMQTNITPSHLSRIRGGERIPSRQVLRALIDALKIDKAEETACWLSWYRARERDLSLKAVYKELFPEGASVSPTEVSQMLTQLRIVGLDDDIAQVLGHVGAQRPIKEVADLVMHLQQRGRTYREENVREVLRHAAADRSASEVADLLIRFREIHPESEGGTKGRPQVTQMLMRYVAADRPAAALVDLLGSRDWEPTDVNHVLMLAGWRRPRGELVKLAACLNKAARPRYKQRVLQNAARSRKPQELVPLIGEFRAAGMDDEAEVLLHTAASRPVAGVLNLVAALETSEDTRSLLRYAGEIGQPLENLIPLTDQIAEAGLTDARMVLRQAAAWRPTSDVVELISRLYHADREDDAMLVVRYAADRPTNEVLALIKDLARAGWLTEHTIRAIRSVVRERPSEDQAVVLEHLPLVPDVVPDMHPVRSAPPDIPEDKLVLRGDLFDQHT